MGFEVAKDAFPQLAPEIRRNQLWLLVWYESNKMLERYFHITEDYIQAFNGIFNGTLTYRNDSLIKHGKYSDDCYHLRVTSPQFNDEEWGRYKDIALSKPRYELCYTIPISAKYYYDKPSKKR